MENLHLWRVNRTPTTAPIAEAVEEIRNTETERLLEDLLVSSPHLLEAELLLIGRQFPTENGPLDLLAIDGAGRLVIIELKRGTLTRDAVAQVLDYTSWIASAAHDRFAADVSIRSGTRGVEKIDDLELWYTEKYATPFGALLQSPRVMLVGVGIDETARRMVQYLAGFGLDISVVAFHAYSINGETFLARSVEIDPSDVVRLHQPADPSGRAMSEGNLTVLTDRAGVGGLFGEVRSVVAEALRTSNHGNAKKSGVTFYRPCWRESRNGNWKAYAKLEPDESTPGKLHLILSDRACREGGQAVVDVLGAFDAKASGSHHGYEEHEIIVDERNWPRVKPVLEIALRSVADGIEAAADESEIDAPAADAD